jgi:hypothetical protein
MLDANTHTNAAVPICLASIPRMCNMYVVDIVVSAKVAASKSDANRRKYFTAQCWSSRCMCRNVDNSLSYTDLTRDPPGGTSPSAERGWKYHPHDAQNADAHGANASPCETRAVLTSPSPRDDASCLFPCLPPAVLPDYCINPAKFENNAELQSTVPVCSDFAGDDLKNGLPCHDFVAGINATVKYMGEFKKGVRAHDEEELINSTFTFWVSIHSRVYNVTEYDNNIRNEQTKQIQKDHPLAYLEPRDQHT